MPGKSSVARHGGLSSADDISARTTPALGLFPQLEFVQQQVRFEPGDILLERVESSVRAHAAGEAASDDITTLAVRRSVPSGHAPRR
jgi:serine phosphatase RsbU (regulator of sigma subunit)